MRKVIVASACDAAHERCSSVRHVDCPLAAGAVQRPAGPRCPFLAETSVRFCAAEPVTRYVRANDAVSSCCNSAGHRHCESYLTAAGVNEGSLPLPRLSGSRDEADRNVVVVDGIPVPTDLWYAPNHMWLDVAEDGRCHVGADAFFTRAVGEVDAVAFATDEPGAGGVRVALAVNGVDLHLVFPVALAGVAANVRLLVDPGRLTTDPYGAGWLLTGSEPPLPGAPIGAVARAGLIGGESAARWIFAEADRLAAFVHETIARPRADGTRLAADGGRVAPGVAHHLDREALLRLFEAFFSPHLQWRGAW